MAQNGIDYQRQVTFTLGSFVAALVAAAKFKGGQPPEMRAKNPIYDEAWTRAETMAAAFDLVEALNLIVTGSSLGDGQTTPRLLPRLIRAAADLKNPREGILS